MLKTSSLKGLKMPSNGIGNKNRRAFPGYELQSILGQGGNGVVYTAREISTDRIVALKTVSRNTPDFARASRRLRLEARLLESLDHDGIIRFLAKLATDSG